LKWRGGPLAYAGHSTFNAFVNAWEFKYLTYAEGPPLPQLRLTLIDVEFITVPQRLTRDIVS